MFRPRAPNTSLVKRVDELVKKKNENRDRVFRPSDGGRVTTVETSRSPSTRRETCTNIGRPVTVATRCRGNTRVFFLRRLLSVPFSKLLRLFLFLRLLLPLSLLSLLYAPPIAQVQRTLRDVRRSSRRAQTLSLAARTKPPPPSDTDGPSDLWGEGEGRRSVDGEGGGDDPSREKGGRRSVEEGGGGDDPSRGRGDPARRKGAVEAGRETA